MPRLPVGFNTSEKQRLDAFMQAHDIQFFSQETRRMWMDRVRAWEKDTEMTSIIQKLA